MKRIPCPRQTAAWARCLVVLAAVAAGCATSEKLSADAPEAPKPLVLTGEENLVLSGLRISNPEGTCIYLRNCRNIRIDQCVLGPALGEGVCVSGCENITITRTRFDNLRAGVYALDSTGINVHHNLFRNVQGPVPRGQFIQFDKVSGPGNRINYNVGVNTPGESDPTDLVNVYKSHGLLDDPIQIVGNSFRGGGPCPSGGGIMTGDGGGSHIVARDNRVVDPGQYGIAIAGGQHIQLIDNWVYGRRQENLTNVGIYVWNQTKGEESFGHTVRGNRVYWINKEGKRTPKWDGRNCGVIEGWNENEWNAPITDDFVPADPWKSGLLPYRPSMPPPKQGGVYVVAHRGAHKGIPENTLAAYRRAMELGVDYVEIDVRTTKDDKFVSVHNSTIDAYVSDGATGKVRDFTLAELKVLDIGSRVGPEWKNERIPAFEEILDLCKGKCGIYLDLKAAPLEPLVEQVMARGMEHDVIWYAPASRLDELRRKHRDCIPMPDPGPEHRLWGILERFQPLVVASVWRHYSPSFLDLCHRGGALVIVDESDSSCWEDALAWGTDGIQTDDPEGLIALLKSRAGDTRE